tara:strand:- start:353 stop:1216 length:864 start_codon:yes stop_codon:yes gene_type:complete
MTTTQILNEGQKMIYGRKRIMDTFYKTHPVGKDILEEDIQSISFSEDDVWLHVEEKLLRIPKSEVIKNFWEHRTRTPSYFDYRIWKSRPQKDGKYIGIPISKVDHDSVANQTLETNIDTLTDEDGVKRIYFVTPEKSSCTCGSFNQMKEHEKELTAEFKEYCPEIDFKPTCKHIKWYTTQINLFSYVQWVNKTYPTNHPRIVVYQYDYRRKKIMYKITNNRYDLNAKWIPKDSWKEKDVYDSSGMPTGNCWSVLKGALKHHPPYKLHPFSDALAHQMNRSSYPKSRY